MDWVVCVCGLGKFCWPQSHILMPGTLKTYPSYSVTSTHTPSKFGQFNAANPQTDLRHSEPAYRHSNWCSWQTAGAIGCHSYRHTAPPYCACRLCTHPQVCTSSYSFSRLFCHVNILCDRHSLYVLYRRSTGTYPLTTQQYVTPTAKRCSCRGPSRYHQLIECARCAKFHVTKMLFTLNINPEGRNM